MGLIASIRNALTPVPVERAAFPWVTFNGHTYPLGMLTQTLQGNREEPPTDYPSVVAYMYKANPVVFACIDNRVKLFSEARLKYRRLRSGRPGELWGDASLRILETPWPGATTGDLLARMEQNALLSGDAFVVRLDGRLAVPRPDWVTIVVAGDVRDLGAPVIGYVYYPGGRYSGQDPVPLDVREVAHFAPIPDPLQPHRGMSPLTPVVREVMADTSATSHKLRFFENGATPNLVVSLDPTIGKVAFDEWVKEFRAGHEGEANAYKTLLLGGGAKVEVVGKDLQQLEFKVTQGAGETRIAAALGVPPVIVGLSEGLAAATYSNYGQARRRFADQTMRPEWRNAAGSLAAIIPVPGGSELWYDDRDISALQEDQKDAADIQAVNVQSIVAAVNGGFQPDSVIAAITSQDLTLLVHSGLTSVQLQPPGTGEPEPPEDTPADDAEDETEAARHAEQVGLLRTIAERLETPPVVNVTTEAPIVNVEPPVVNVEPPVVHVAAPVVNVEAPVVNVPAPEVTVEAPVVNVAPPDLSAVREDLAVMRAEANAPVRKAITRGEDGRIEAITEVRTLPPEPPSEIEQLADAITERITKPRRKRIERDAAGLIVAITEEQ